MNFEEIIQQIKHGKIAPIYFLHGEEPYFIDKISETVQKHALNDEERSFNELIMYGKDTDSTNLVHAARQYPMGGKRQLIILREAQNLAKIEILENYFKAPLQSTVLVITYKYKSFDKRTKTYIALSKQPQAVVFESKKLKENEIYQWISKFITEKGLTIEPRASDMLIDFLGAELEKVAQSVEKLTVALGHDKKLIRTDDVINNIGMSKEYNPFELQKAIINKDVMKANRIVKAFAANEKDYPIPMITTILFSYFSKLLMYYYVSDKSPNTVMSELKVSYPAVDDYKRGAQNYKGTKLLEIISLLREYDMKSKGFGNVSASHGDLLKELVFKIIH